LLILHSDKSLLLQPNVSPQDLHSLKVLKTTPLLAYVFSPRFFVVNLFSQELRDKFSQPWAEELTMFYTLELVAVMEQIYSVGIINNNISPATLLVQTSLFAPSSAKLENWTPKTILRVQIKN
jgi:hypothetical protein